MGGKSQHGQHGGMNNSSVGEQFTEIYLKRDSNVQVQGKVPKDWHVLSKIIIFINRQIPILFIFNFNTF